MSGILSIGRRQLVDERHEKRLEQARRYWPQISEEDLEVVGKYIADRASGVLYTRVAGLVDYANRESNSGIRGFVATPDGSEIVFLQRPENSPATVEELEQARQAAQAQEVREQKERQAWLRAQPTKVVTLSDLEGVALPTVREAAQMIVSCGGHIREVDGHLQLSLPERVSGAGIAGMFERETRAPYLAAARVLYAAENLVLQELQRGKGKLDPARLPDQHVLPNGAIA